VQDRHCAAVLRGQLIVFGRVVGSGLVMALALTLLGVATPAAAFWRSAGTGSAAVDSGTLEPPTQPLAISGDSVTVTVSWQRSAGILVPEGYYVERDAGGVTEPACGSSASALVTASACTDGSVPAGSYTYRIVAVFRSWTTASVSSALVSIVPTVLGAAESFSVLGTAVTSTGFTRISGDLGVTPGTAVVGFPDGRVDGDIHAGDSIAAAARAAAADAFASLSALTADAEISGDLIGRTISPGVYRAGAALALTGVLTLDAGGDPNARFIFQAGAAVNTAAASAVVLTNGAQASNVYWVVAAAFGSGAVSSVAGTILASGAITLGAGSSLIGRALSFDAVTLAENDIRFTVGPAPTIALIGGPSVVTKDTTPTIAGTTTAGAGRTVTVSVGGATVTSTVQADQSWAVTTAELSAGSYSIVAAVKDATGNGARAAQSLVVEVSPPTVPLGTAATFAILAGTSVVSTGASFVTGDVGVSPGTSVSGLPPGAVSGTIHVGDAIAADAVAALSDSIADASGRLPHREFSGDLVGAVFHAGVHHSSVALALTGTMTLDAEGDPSAVFIVQVDAAMNTAASSSVVLANGARAANVFWVVDGAVGTGALSSLPGTILASGVITLGAGTSLVGRALTLSGIVMAEATIISPTGG